jgi:ribonuclease HIII
MSGPLRDAAEAWTSGLEARGFAVSGPRELVNGLQYTVSRGGRSCRAGLYHSGRRGFSVVYAGGDRELYESLRQGGAAGALHGGSDEAGKGDYFGPLVAAATVLDGRAAQLLAGAGMADSKLLDDATILRLDPEIRRVASAFSVQSIAPAAYNRAMAGMPPGRNSLDLLAGLHAAAITAVAAGADGLPFTVDRFCPEGRLVPLLPGGPSYALVTRGERVAAVAAASVLARAEYLRALAVLGARFGAVLRPGSGDPADRAGAALVGEWGPGVLVEAAKVHFANTGRILAMAGLDGRTEIP